MSRRRSRRFSKAHMARIGRKGGRATARKRARRRAAARRRRR